MPTSAVVYHCHGRSLSTESTDGGDAALSPKQRTQHEIVHPEPLAMAMFRRRKLSLGNKEIPCIFIRQ